MGQPAGGLHGPGEQHQRRRLVAPAQLAEDAAPDLFGGPEHLADELALRVLLAGLAAGGWRLPVRRRLLLVADQPEQGRGVHPKNQAQDDNHDDADAAQPSRTDGSDAPAVFDVLALRLVVQAHDRSSDGRFVVAFGASGGLPPAGWQSLRYRLCAWAQHHLRIDRVNGRSAGAARRWDVAPGR
jgi:hypothetical protein